ncbi:MAG: hypothetical protein EOM80_12500 [Erysipelotrichia bacterium]|nr:hypothetical protein [Erysipelotrichia bacterium]
MRYSIFVNSCHDVSIQVHHGLADGLHVARFLEQFQQLLSLQK